MVKIDGPRTEIFHGPASPVHARNWYNELYSLCVQSRSKWYRKRNECEVMALQMLAPLRVVSANA